MQKPDQSFITPIKRYLSGQDQKCLPGRWLVLKKFERQPSANTLLCAVEVVNDVAFLLGDPASLSSSSR